MEGSEQTEDTPTHKNMATQDGLQGQSHNENQGATAKASLSEQGERPQQLHVLPSVMHSAYSGHDSNVTVTDQTTISTQSNPKDMDLEVRQEINPPSTTGDVSKEPPSHAAPKADLSVQHVEAEIVEPGSIDKVEPLNVESVNSKGSSTNMSEGLVPMSTDNMDLTPAAASLLPNSGVPRASTPMLEAEPVMAHQAGLEAKPTGEDLPEPTPSASALGSAPEQGHSDQKVEIVPEPISPADAVESAAEQGHLNQTAEVVPAPTSSAEAVESAAEQGLPDQTARLAPEQEPSPLPTENSQPVPESIPQDAPAARDTLPPPAPGQNTSHLMAGAREPVPAAEFAAAPALRHQQPQEPGETLSTLDNVEIPEAETDPPIDTLSEDGFSDTDSALGGMSYISSSTSVTSSIYESVEEHGRTYHSYKPGKYMLPNDPAEQDRLDFQHQIFLLCNDGRLFLAPLDPTRVNRVLDIATGTGIWAIDFADDFPNAEVIGSDLSPIQPRWCPPNCRFEVDDAEDEWVWSEPFSYIHGRALLTCFADPKEVIRSAFNSLEPGGYLEFQDATFPFEYEDPSLPRVELGRMDRPYAHPLQRWSQISLEASHAAGRPWNNVQHYKRFFEEVGFVDVVEVRIKLALGVHQGLTEKEFKLGSLHGPSVHQGLEGMSNRNFQRLGYGVEETKQIVSAARKTFSSNRNTAGAYNWAVTVYGRKPE